MKRKYFIIAFIVLLFIAFGCSSVETKKATVMETYSQFPVPYLSDKEYQQPYFTDFIKYIKPYISKGVPPEKELGTITTKTYKNTTFIEKNMFNNTLYNDLDDDKNKVPYPLTFKSVMTLDKIMKDKRAERREENPYEILEFKDIRYETAEPNKVDYRYGLYEDIDYNFGFYDLFALFMIEHYDIQNEKDLQYYWMKVQTAITYENYNDFDVDDIGKNKIHMSVCEERGESNKWVMKSLFHVPTYTLDDTRPGVLSHLWSSYCSDGEWWSSDWSNNFIANFAIYIGSGVADKTMYDLAVKHKADYIFKDDTPLTKEDYEKRIAWLRDDIYENGARDSFLSKMHFGDFSDFSDTQEQIMYARSYGKLGEEYVLRETINSYAYKMMKDKLFGYKLGAGGPLDFYYLSPKEFFKVVEDILQYKRETMNRRDYVQFRDRLMKDTEWFTRTTLKRQLKSFKKDYGKLCIQIEKDTTEFNQILENDKNYK